MKRTVAAAIVMFIAGVGVGHRLATWSGGQMAIGVETPLVTGIGGVFFKAADPAKLRTWYREHLGIDAGEYGVNFFWREEHDATRYGRTVWSLFPKDTTYFGDDTQQVMINYRVRDLDQLLSRLRSRGIRQVGETEELWYGRFAWVLDGERNRVELWQPVNHSRAEFDRRLKREAVPGAR